MNLIKTHRSKRPGCLLTSNQLTLTLPWAKARMGSSTAVGQMRDYARAALSRRKINVHLEIRVNRASEMEEQGKERLKIEDKMRK